MIVVDVETTGIGSKTHSIIQIGAVDFSNPNNRFSFSCRAFDGAKIDEESIKVHGIPMEKILDKTMPSEAEAMVSFVGWAKDVKDITLAGYNTSFDRDFIKDASIRANVNWWHPVFRTIDIHSTAYAKHLELGRAVPLINNHSDINLDVTLEFVGLPKRTGFHDALDDALLEAEAFSRLVYGKSLMIEYKKYDVPPYLIQSN